MKNMLGCSEANILVAEALSVSVIEKAWLYLRKDHFKKISLL